MSPRETMTSTEARRLINRLSEHLSWLEDRIATKEAEGRLAGHERARAAALRWAIELCENEWDVLVRRPKERAG